MKETTKDTKTEAFNKWADKLEKMSDLDVSREIYNRMMQSDDLDKETKKLLEAAYEYCVKLINQNKPLEPNLLKIYLEQIKGYHLAHINLVNLVLMLSMCGINFSSTPSQK